MNRLRQFIYNGLLLTAVSVLMRSVGVSYNVYLSNKIGAVAMGLFTLISTVYGFAITLATSGIGLATTRLVAQALGKDDQGGRSEAVRYTVRKCVGYSLLFSALATILLYVLAPDIGISLLKDERTVRPMQILALTLVPISLSSVLTGYFVAVRRVYKNALTQIVGQGVKIYASVLLLGSVFGSGIESACIAVAVSGILSEGISLSIQMIFYWLEKKKQKEKSLSVPEKRKIQKELWNTALPVALSAYVRSGLITVEHMLIPRGLVKSGASRDLSLAAYGIVHSMVFPLVLFPSALSSSFAGLLIPEVAQAQTQQDHKKIERMIQKVFSCVLTYAIGTAGILMCFAYPLAKVIYPNTEAGKYILMISPLIPVMYLDTSTDAFLKGMGEQFYCMVVNIVDAFLSVILVWILLPRMGITGYIVTVYFTEIVNAALSIARLLYVSKVRIRLFSWLIRPLLCIAAAMVSSSFLIRILNITVSSALCLTVQILLGVAIYLLLITLFVRKNNFSLSFSVHE